MRKNDTSEFSWLQPIAFFVVSLFVAGLIFMFCCRVNPESKAEFDDISPKEQAVVTMEMNYKVIYDALSSEDAKALCSVNNPSSFLGGINLTIKDKGGFFDSEVAEDTAKSFPSLFKYDEKSREFTIKSVHTIKGYVVVPAWLVASMIEKGLLKL